MKKLILTLFVLLPGVLFAQYSNLGASGAQFLEIPVSASSAGMGGVSAGMVKDASSVFLNPAGLAHVKAYDVQFSYLKLYDLFDMNSFVIGYAAGETGVLGVSLVSLTSGKIEITTEKEPNGTGRFYDASDLALGLSYARFLTDRFSAGINVKYIYQRIWNETADGFAFDIGTQYRIDYNNLTIAMAMTNFGPDLRFDGPDLNVVIQRDENFPLSRLAPASLKTDPYSLPLHFRVGVAMDLYQYEFMKVRGGIDATHPNDNAERLHAGAEFTFFDRLYLRGGYKYNYDDEMAALGAGFSFFLGESVVRFDYAYSLFDVLPDIQRISVSMEF